MHGKSSYLGIDGEIAGEIAREIEIWGDLMCVIGSDEDWSCGSACSCMCV